MNVATIRHLARAAAIALAIGGLGYWIGRHRPATQAPESAQSQERYQCSMHPEIVSDKPGDCPICGMRLQKVEEHGKRSDTGAGTERNIRFYRHPMRPDLTSPAPAKDEMGMDYTPVYSDEPGGESASEDRASFMLPPERQQLIGVKTATATVRPLAVEVKAVGKVAYDPELYNAIEEYKQAAAAREKVKESPLPEARQGADALARSAATRLRLLGLSEEQVAALFGDGESHMNLLLPGKTAWIYADVYEYEVDLLRPGLAMMVSAPSLPGRVYRGKLVGVNPVLNAETRTARIRGLIDTPDEALRPELFVNVKLHVALGRRLAVPEDAVLDTGERQVVFVKKGGGEFESREIKAGRQAKGYYEVLSGLEEGEEIVTAANFLIDSESRFKAALSAFGTPKKRAK